MSLRILGIDPGTRHTGYAVIQADDQPLPLDWGSISPTAALPIEQRLNTIHKRLVELVRQWHPDEVAIEEPFLGKGERRFVGPAFAVGQAQAVALVAATSEGIPIFRYSPAQVKIAVTDYGAATKEQVQQMVCSILRLETSPISADASDALALCLCHLHRNQVEGALSQEIIMPMWSRP